MKLQKLFAAYVQEPEAKTPQEIFDLGFKAAQNLLYANTIRRLKQNDQAIVRGRTEAILFDIQNCHSEEFDPLGD